MDTPIRRLLGGWRDLVVINDGLTSPLVAFQRVLLAPIRDLAIALDQVAKKKQAG